MTSARQVRAARLAAEAERVEAAFADQRKLHDAIATVSAWHRAGVPALTPLEVIDLLANGVRDAEGPAEEGTPPGLASAQPHPREAERDPLFGTLPVTAAPQGPRQAAGPPLS